MMTEDDVINDFGQLSTEQKQELFDRLSEELGVEPGNIEEFGVEGEVTLRVLDEDGDEKTVETESFKY